MTLETYQNRVNRLAAHAATVFVKKDLRLCFYIVLISDIAEVTLAYQEIVCILAPRDDPHTLDDCNCHHYDQEYIRRPVDIRLEGLTPMASVCMNT